MNALEPFFARFDPYVTRPWLTGLVALVALFGLAATGGTVQSALAVTFSVAGTLTAWGIEARFRGDARSEGTEAEDRRSRGALRRDLGVRNVRSAHLPFEPRHR